MAEGISSSNAKKRALLFAFGILVCVGVAALIVVAWPSPPVPSNAQGPDTVAQQASRLSELLGTTAEASEAASDHLSEGEPIPRGSLDAFLASFLALAEEDSETGRFCRAVEEPFTDLYQALGEYRNRVEDSEEFRLEYWDISKEDELVARLQAIRIAQESFEQYAEHAAQLGQQVREHARAAGFTDGEIDQHFEAMFWIPQGLTDKLLDGEREVLAAGLAVGEFLLDRWSTWTGDNEDMLIVFDEDGPIDEFDVLWVALRSALERQVATMAELAPLFEERSKRGRELQDQLGEFTR